MWGGREPKEILEQKHILGTKAEERWGRESELVVVVFFRLSHLQGHISCSRVRLLDRMLLNFLVLNDLLLKHWFLVLETKLRFNIREG